ncbi:MAG: hypothetical protein JJU05_16790 [Verrucomicrobia bacterium]|nr:hypothetical protein [Verrucomicrobiota bacterium]MCH8526372.1 hypothetical protein [Kiritimatiellia bacterium]
MQSESEATVNLILAARHINRKLSIAQSNEIQKYLDVLPWTSGTGKSVFVQMATASLRKALATPESMEAFLRTQAEKFESAEAKHQALQMVLSVLNADGLDETERLFQDRITELLS